MAGNWKSNGSKTSARALAAAIAAEAIGPDVDVVVCPPFPFLMDVATIFDGSDIRVGAQNLSETGSGAYTGEVHAEMLADVGCDYVLVGHSERRTLLGESDASIANKLARALAAGLTPILCVGETLGQRESGAARQVVLGQLESVVAHLGLADLERMVVAYEPVWAIGTGRSASPEQAQEVHGWLRAWLRNAIGQAAAAVRLLYGGSVSPKNASTLFRCGDIDGALVGGASLNAKDFLEICLDASRSSVQS